MKEERREKSERRREQRGKICFAKQTHNMKTESSGSVEGNGDT